jgi:multidrug resistance protein MdtO
MPRFCAAGARRTAAAGRREKAPLLLPDAWSNPAYLHFALKTLLATLLCYVFYTAADWQGIHTIMLSCVIVAQPGLGATLQKTWLRIGGALLATLLALLMIVFIQPGPIRCRPAGDDPAGAGAGGVDCRRLGAHRLRRDSDWLYLALAFLSWFGPLTNLTELRDRVIGILLGVLVSSIVHFYLWPDSEAPQLKSRLADLYRRLAECLAARAMRCSWSPVCRLTDSETLIHRVRAEPLGTYAHPWPEAKAGRCAPPSPGRGDRPPQRRLPAQRRAGRYLSPAAPNGCGLRRIDRAGGGSAFGRWPPIRQPLWPAAGHRAGRPARLGPDTDSD